MCLALVPVGGQRDIGFKSLLCLLFVSKQGLKREMVAFGVCF